MCTKKCKKCGWEYPLITSYAVCRFCGTPFEVGQCKVCGHISSNLVPYTNTCQECFKALHPRRNKDSKSPAEASAAYYKRQCEEADRAFIAWQESLHSVHIQTLTEAEWLEACRFFGGCAICHSSSIDARGYFIPFKYGGSYNRCNVIPLCEACATDYHRQINPFRYLNPTINNSLALSRGITRKSLDNIVAYLQPKIRSELNE